MATEQQLSNTDFTNWALTALAQKQSAELAAALQEQHPSVVANIIASVPVEQRSALFSLLPEQTSGLVLHLLPDEIRNQLLNNLDTDAIAGVAEYLGPNELADSLDALPDSVSDAIIGSLDADNLKRVNAVLEYPEGSAGRVMTTDALSVKPEMTIRVVLRWLRKLDSLPPFTSSLMVTDNDGIYLGKLPMSGIVTGNLDASVESAMITNNEVLQAAATEHDVAQLFEQRQLVTAAVLDENNRLIGRITVERAMDILKREADHRLLSSRGLSDEADLFAPIIPSAKQRGVWLGINLVTVFLAAWVIGQFQFALDKIVALAVLMPIVASMGGIAGSQTLTLTIRGLALDQIVKSNMRWLATKELGVGLLNGLVWSVVVAVVTYLWFENIGLAIIIGVALILNLIAASISGVAVPLTLKKMGLDPALSGAVVLTTVTDIVGFLSFLGLASIFLL